MAAVEIQRPPVPNAPANDQRFNQRLRAWDMHTRLRNGHSCTVTTVARNSCAAIANVERIYGDAIKGVTPKQIV